MSELFSLQLEKHTLSGLLNHKDVFSELITSLTSADFYNNTHEVIFSVYKDCYLKQEVIDKTILAQKITNLGLKFRDEISIFDYIESLYFNQITAEATVKSANELIKLRIRREICQSADKIKNFVIENGDKDLNSLISETDKIYNEKVKSFKMDNESINLFETMEDIIEGIADDPPKEENSMFGPFNRLNEQYGSLVRPGNMNLVVARTGAGKAQPLFCNVLTPYGWKKIGDLKINDEVCSPDATITKVVGIYPQGEKDIYKITLDDNDYTFSCGEHLWFTKTHLDRRNRKFASCKNLFNIKNSLYHKTKNCDNRLNHSIDFVEPIDFKQMELLPISPYVLGCLIGNGKLSKGSIVFSTADKFVLERFVNELPDKDCCIFSSGVDYRIKRKRKNGEKSEILKSIIKLGLYGTYSETKFIPNCYLRSSKINRLALLQGLVDTDGYVNKNKCTIDYSTASKILAYQVKDLVQSFGAKATISTKIPFYTYKGKKLQGMLSYRVFFSFNNDIIPFSSSYKGKFFRKKTRLLQRYIKNIEFFNKENCVCIKVENPNGLYITDNYIITHNTSLGMFYLNHIAEKHNIPILQLDNCEMSPFELQIRSAVMLTKGIVPSYSLETGIWRNNPEHLKLIREVWPRVKKMKLYYQQIGDMDEDDIINYIKHFYYTKIGRGNRFLIHLDYLKDFQSNYHESEWQRAGRFIKKLKGLLTTDIPTASVWTALQSNKMGITNNKHSSQINDSDDIFSISDRIAHQMTHSWILRNKSNDEIEQERNMFGNMKLIPIKKRHLGKDIDRALSPVKTIDGKYKGNYFNISSKSFYFEEKGDLVDMTEKLKDMVDIDTNDEIEAKL